jgi:hypothetical protein
MQRDALVKFFKRFLLEKRFEDEDEAENAAEEFVTFCTGRAWVLSSVGSDSTQELYGFTHRTFLEYFAANQLVRLHPTSAPLFKQLKWRISRAEWDVVSQLALQILGTNTDSGMDEFLDRVISAAQTGTLEESANLLSFAGRSLNFVVPRPAVIRRICEASVELALGIPKEEFTRATSRSHHLRGISALQTANAENRPSVGRLLRRALSNDGGTKPPRKVRETKLALALNISLIRDQAALGGPTQSDLAYWREFEDDNFDHFENEVRALSQETGWVAVEGASAGILSMSSVMEKFAPEVLYQYLQGPLTIRAPFVYRIDRIGRADERHRVVASVDECLSELSSVLPLVRDPWFVTSYSYEPIMNDARHRFRRPLHRYPQESRDAIILLAAAWAELDFASKNPPRRRIVAEQQQEVPSASSMASRWTVARRDPDQVSGVLRSINACRLKDETISLLTDWVEGEFNFVKAGIRTKQRQPQPRALRDL